MNDQTLKDELERKTLETYEWLIERSSQAEFGDPEIRVALQAVFNVTCGLVSHDITLSAEMVDLDKLERLVNRRVFVTKSGSLAVVSWKTGDSVVTVTTVNGPEQAPRQFEAEDARAAKASYFLLCKKFESRGFLEVT